MKLLKLITIVIVVCIACISCTSPLHQDKSTQQYKNKPIPKVGVQLWSVKEELKADFKGTLTQLADMGFEGVELAGEFGPYKDDAKGLKAFLDSLGLEASSAHAPFAAFDDEHFDKSVAFYKTLKTETLIIPWDDRGWDSAKVDSLITDLNVLFTKLKAEGFHFGYHNHEQEFDDHKDATFWDHIAKSTPKDFVLQMDVGWVTLAEKDPVEYINRYPNRTLTTHIKAKLPRDVAAKMATNGKRQIVGDDVTNWDAVIKADIMVGGTKWFVIEQEEYPDGLTPLQAVKLSKQGLDKAIINL
ncbi:sugar phosphate isomerase/epimerase family protein [Cognaticolwellia beringensis]|uniref:Sugar phosphate isomerase/epimerase n=1 Tax=Cognaticolwellia beringensis TaxID=1967665 RepID=A0A222GBU0_9GAMM|nr:sugar phosphate isomerase/epimerase [Cognaticolwellia beringensis]ASP49349.1 sugar phosphate isomerase/epimerase [Cognaticolwellia beringensis]